MASSPFLSWPLWHSFTLHFQNVARNTPKIKALSPSTDGDLVRRDDGSEYAEAIKYMAFYDFMADKIVLGQDVEEVTIISASELLTSSRFSKDKDTIVIAKGSRVRSSGGEFASYIGTAYNVRLVMLLLVSAIQEKPLDNLDTLAKDINIDKMMADPKYDNPITKVILQSYSRQARAPSDDSRIISKISSRISGSMPDNKAVNIVTGMNVSQGLPRYTYYEYSVQAPSDTTRKVVRFAIPTNVSPEDRDYYLGILHSTFRAEQVTTTQESEEDREAIEIRPVRLTSREYQNLFPGTSSTFSSYFNPVTSTVTKQIADPGQTLHGEAFSVEEDDDYEDIEDM